MAMTQMEQFIREYAASIGLNPDVVMQTVLSEGGRSSLEPAGYARQSLVQSKKGQETSYGPFQMFIGGGLGDRALKAGIDPRNPANAFKVAKFAMDVMNKEGLGHWHGWKGDKWAAHGGKATGKEVGIPGVDTDYDPRLDTPSTGKPKGSELPGPPASAMPSQYDLPDNKGGFDIAELREALEDKMTPAEHLGAGLMDVKMPTGGFDYKVPPVQPAALAQAQPTPMINPQQAAAKREGLAAVMARLNAPAEAQAAQAAQAAMFARALKGLG